MNKTENFPTELRPLAEKLFREEQQRVYRATDRLFAWLLCAQWLGAVVVALVVAPRTWIGTRSEIHIHVWAALILGGIITSLPVVMVVLRPGATLTRHVVAIGQMLSSALLIHVTGGRIETHFHVFGSLAILSFYRDWRVLVSATVVVAADHFLRGMFYPESVYGVLVASQWRFIEHAWWVIFENVFLAAACFRSMKEMRGIAERTVALQQSEERTRLVVDTALDAVVAMNSGGVITGWNSQATAIFGWSADEAMGKQLSGLIIPPALRAAHEQGLQRFLSTGEGPVLGKRIEITALRRDGQEFPVELAISPSRVGDATVFNAFIRDITERKRSEQELRNAKEAAEGANKAKSEFLANMSHEIRTPLNGVIGMVDLLLGTKLDERQRRHVTVAKTSATSLLSLINGILDFSKIEAGRLELNPTDFDLSVAVEDVAEMFAERAQKKGLELAVHLDQQLQRRVRGDQDRLRQILVNLINNAIKFTDRGSVFIRGTCEQHSATSMIARFAVSDTGIGIPSDRIDRLFKSFSQVDASTTRRFGGTGLGLAISKQLCELMGGKIAVQSREAEGTTIWFTVQIQPLETTPTAPELLEKVANLRVLIVSGSHLVQDLLTKQFASWGMKSNVADSAELGLAKIRVASQLNQPFRLAIVDTRLNDMEADVFAQRMKTESPSAETLLLLMSDFKQPANWQQLHRLGFRGVVSKPVRQSTLFDIIMGVLSGPAADPGSVEHSPNAEPPPQQFTGNILLVEDNEVNQMVAVEILRNAGFAVEVAGNGKVAVEMVSKGDRPIDLILMDCQMPEMDGFEASGAIRQLEARSEPTSRRRVPIVALTANAMKGDRERCLEAGMDGYITKPIDAAVLLRTISQFLTGASPAEPAPARETSTKEQTNGFPFDTEALLRTCMGKRDLARRMLDKFRSQATEQLALLSNAVADRKVAEIERSAHSIKGMSATIAAEPVRAAAQEIEAAARANELDAIAEKLSLLRKVIDDCVAALPMAAEKLGDDANSRIQPEGVS